MTQPKLSRLEASDCPVVKIGINGRTYLDILRAIAAQMVLVQHVSSIFEWPRFIASGGAGVCLFFILSGFLIFQSAVKRLGRPGNHFLPFIIDRFARIYTGYLPVLLIVAALNVWPGISPHAQEGVSSGPVALLGNTFMMQDYPLFQSLSLLTGSHAFHIRSYNGAEPFWTVAIEFWIYVWFGLIFFKCLRGEALKMRYSVPLFLISTPVIIWHAAGGPGEGLVLVWFYGALISYLWGSILGRGIARKSIGFSTLALAGIFFAGHVAKYGMDFHDHATIIICCIAFAGGLMLVESLPKFPSWLVKFATGFASYSYSLYLSHNTVLILCRERLGASWGHHAWVFAVIAAHAVAIILYFLFERHHREVGGYLKKMLRVA